MQRYGFPVRIVESIDYTLSSGKLVKALVTEKTGEERPFDVRMFYRVAPTGHCDVSMTIHGTPIHVLDISLGGAKVSHDKSLELQSNAVVYASIEMNGRYYSFGARVLRTWEGEDFKLRFASMEFTNMDKRLQYVLSQKIRGIERESLPKETHSVRRPLFWLFGSRFVGGKERGPVAAENSQNRSPMMYRGAGVGLWKVNVTNRSVGNNPSSMKIRITYDLWLQ